MHFLSLTLFLSPFYFIPPQHFGFDNGSVSRCPSACAHLVPQGGEARHNDRDKWWDARRRAKRTHTHPEASGPKWVTSCWPCAATVWVDVCVRVLFGCSFTAATRHTKPKAIQVTRCACFLSHTWHMAGIAVRVIGFVYKYVYVSTSLISLLAESCRLITTTTPQHPVRLRESSRVGFIFIWLPSLVYQSPHNVLRYVKALIECSMLTFIFTVMVVCRTGQS